METNRSRVQDGRWCENPAANIQSVCSLGLCRKRIGPLRTIAGGYSDIGNVRKTNDDLVFASNDCRLYVVLDGVGGNAGGRQASLIVLEKLRSHIEAMCGADAKEADHDLECGVRTALKAATNSMLSVAGTHPDLAKMATVFALAYVIDGVLLYTHVGDCRVYVIRRGQARQLTSDETFVQLMVDKGAITPDDVPDHPMKNVILNSVGTRSVEYAPIVHTEMLLPGDTVVLTSDGVTDYLSNEELASLACNNLNPEAQAESLVRAALVAGSRDNASCIVVNIDRAKEATSDTRTDLHFELAKLHDLLSTADSFDAGLRDEMQQVAEDLRLALKKTPSDELTQLKDQLQSQTLGFEVKHPRLTAIVSTVTDLLARMGI